MYWPLKKLQKISKTGACQNSVASPPKDSQGSAQKAPQTSPQIALKPSPKDIGFFDPSLQHDFPELCLFRNIDIFCDRIERCRSESEFLTADIVELLPKCLRGEALAWFRSQSKHRYLAVCLAAIRARFAQAPPEAPPKAPPEHPCMASKHPRRPPREHLNITTASSAMPRFPR